MPNVFLIYTRKDDIASESITDDLLISGIGAFFIDDHNVTVWSHEEVLRDWMLNSDILLVIWTKNASESTDVQKELEVALDTGKKIILMKVGEIGLPKIPAYCPIISVDSISKISSALTEYIRTTKRYKLFISYSRQDIKQLKQFGHLRLNGKKRTLRSLSL